MATSRSPNIRPESGADRLRDRVRVRLVSRFRAGGHNRRRWVTPIEAGLFVLVVSTASAIASVSVWWVPVYLALLVMMFVISPRRSAPLTTSELGAKSVTIGITDLGSGLRVDCADGVDELHSFSQSDSAATNLELTEPTDSNSGLNTAGTIKRRGRVRARKAAPPASEPVTDALPVVWIQVGPGKFVRVEGGIQTVNPTQTEEVVTQAHPAVEAPAETMLAAPFQIEPLAEQESFASSGYSPDDVEPIPVSSDLTSRLVTEEYGIAPSAFSLTTEYESSAKASDFGLAGEVDHPEITTSSPTIPSGLVSPGSPDLELLLWQSGASRRWVRRIQRGVALRAPRLNGASLRRVTRTSANPRPLVKSLYAPNISRRAAARCAIGRVLRHQLILRTRAPPCR